MGLDRKVFGGLVLWFRIRARKRTAMVWRDAPPFILTERWSEERRLLETGLLFEISLLPMDLQSY